MTGATGRLFNMKTLVAYFSAEGTTAKVARELADKTGADLYEIRPEKPYTAADIRWINPLARCNREMLLKKDGFEQYDRVLLGFPIWYGCAPGVVNTFCKGYDWTGKRVFAFATSGGGGIGKTAEKLAPFVPGAAVVDAKVVHDACEVIEWVKDR